MFPACLTACSKNTLEQCQISCRLLVVVWCGVVSGGMLGGSMCGDMWLWCGEMVCGEVVMYCVQKLYLLRVDTF